MRQCGNWGPQRAPFCIQCLWCSSGVQGFDHTNVFLTCLSWFTWEQPIPSAKQFEATENQLWSPRITNPVTGNPWNFCDAWLTSLCLPGGNAMFFIHRPLQNPFRQSVAAVVRVSYCNSLTMEQKTVRPMQARCFDGRHDLGTIHWGSNKIWDKHVPSCTKILGEGDQYCSNYNKPNRVLRCFFFFLGY